MNHPGNIINIQSKKNAYRTSSILCTTISLAINVSCYLYTTGTTLLYTRPGLVIFQNPLLFIIIAGRRQSSSSLYTSH